MLKGISVKADGFTVLWFHGYKNAPFSIGKRMRANRVRVILHLPHHEFFRTVPHYITEREANVMWFYKDLGVDGHCHRWKAVNQCERCGAEFESRSPSSTLYCPECAPIVRAERNRERVRRFREKHQATK